MESTMTDSQPNIHQSRRRRFLKGSGVAVIGALTGCLSQAAGSGDSSRASDTPTETPTATEPPSDATTIQVKQNADRLVYWVLPGKRRLSEQVFGTPDNPKSLVKPVIEKAKKPAMKKLLQQFPILVGVPEKKRATSDGQFTTTTFPTPFSDKAEVVDGKFDLSLVDRQAKDADKPTKTEDEIDLSATFTDPVGNNYELQVKTPFAPPIPGYKTGGGVRTDFFHHGLTGTGSPLMPKVYSPGAFWGVGNVIANGEVVDQRKVIHFMSTQTVRTNNYRLAIDEELPLAKGETIAGQLHHMHAIVVPVTITKQGKPKFEPVKMPFSIGQSDKKQPFIHVMYEQDTIVDSSFDLRIPQPEKTPTPTGTPGTPTEGAITVRGKEYTFDPHRIVVKKGQETTITFENIGTIAHNFVIGALGVRTPTIQPGESASVTFTPENADVYGFWCAVPGHQDEGMQGRLVIEE